MIVYVELVLFDNFCLDFLIGELTLRFVRKEFDLFRTLLSSFVGCLFALISPLVTHGVLFFKIAVLFVNAALLYLRKPLRGYLITTFVYAVISFTLSGIFTFLLGGKASFSFINVDRGGVIGLIALSGILLSYICRQIRGLIKEKRMTSKYAVAELFYGNNSVKLRALMDSGNLLTDEEGNGIVVSDEKALSPLHIVQPYSEIKVSTTTGERMLKLIKIPCVKIYSEGQENTLNNVTVALSDLPDDYAVILPT